jgi:hypothetical protein
MQEIAFLSLRKSKIFWGSMPPDPPRSVSVNQKSYSYAPDSSCDIRISRAQHIKAEISENCYAFSNTQICAQYARDDNFRLSETK